MCTRYLLLTLHITASYLLQPLFTITAPYPSKNDLSEDTNSCPFCMCKVVSKTQMDYYNHIRRHAFRVFSVDTTEDCDSCGFALRNFSQ